MAEHSSAQREFALEVVRRLRDAGQEALWAGGCVRDQLLGIPPKDYDVATSARPEQVRELFGHRRTLAIGAAFGVITVLAKKPLEPVEVATFRTDGEYHDGRRPESVAFTDARHDAARRDFTINGLFFDPIAECVVDYVGGQADLQAGIVRAIGDPAQRFAEDRLRMLRAVRFAATYDFELEPATLASIQSMAAAVTEVSIERVAAELRRILVHPSRARGLALLAQAELLKPILPELAPHFDANDANWDVAVGRLTKLESPSFSLALSAAFEGMVAPHEARVIGKRLRLSNKDIDRTVWLLEHWPRMHEAAALAWPRLQRLLAHEGGPELLTLAEASLPAGDPGLTRCREQLSGPPSQWNPPPLVTGDDLLTHGFKSGRHFAELLEHLRDAQLEGSLASRDDALAEAERWIKRRQSEERRSAHCAAPRTIGAIGRHPHFERSGLTMYLHSAVIDGIMILSQAAAEPTIDGAFIARLVSRVIHILFAIILGGGLFYMRSILSPSGADSCFAGRRGIWARWVGVATFLLLASGLFNYITIVRAAKAAGHALPPSYHMLFGIKFLLALVVFFIAAILAGKTSAADRFRANMPRWLKLSWTAVMAIVVIGALLRAYHS